MFANPPLRAIDARYLAFACSSCKQVSNLSLFADSPYYRKSYSAVLGPLLEVDTVQLDSLECVEPSCREHVPLFAQWNPTSTAEEREADSKTWRADGLLCPQGHEMTLGHLL